MRHVRLFLITALLAVLCAPILPAVAQPLDDLERLPPLGDPAVETESGVATLLAPAEVIGPLEGPGTAWWRPNDWFSSTVWDFGAEMGLNGSEGNAQSLSILASVNGKRETEGNVLEWDLKYGKSQASGVETQHYSLFNSRWDWKFTPLWFLYNKDTVEYDEFKAFDLRLVLSGGLGRHLIKSDVTTLTARLGAGVSREFGGPDEEWVPEANIGGDYEHKISPRQKVKLTTDYYPAWENFEDYRMVTNAYWEILLSEETNLSLKLGAVDRYDSTPNGALANDIDYFVTLLWKL
jgi:putative salt-induced outer membrane protein YdiY